MRHHQNGGLFVAEVLDNLVDRREPALNRLAHRYNTCFTHSLWLLAAGLLMTAAAGGDLLIASLILKNKMPDGTLYLDHPTEIGLVCFTR